MVKEKNVCMGNDNLERSVKTYLANMFLPSMLLVVWDSGMRSEKQAIKEHYFQI